MNCCSWKSLSGITKLRSNKKCQRAPRPGAPPMAQAPTTSGGSGMALLNLENTVALHGYDAVAYFERERAVRGNKRILERVGGATYFFASRASRYTFLQNAPAYQPQFGGYCATSMARGRLEDIDPEIFVIFDGKLYLFKDDEALGGVWRSHHGRPAQVPSQNCSGGHQDRRAKGEVGGVAVTDG